MRDRDASVDLLLVDGEGLLSSAVVAGLRREPGWRVTVMRDGGEAVNAFVSRAPAAAVVSGPGQPSQLTGVDLCRVLRALSACVGLVLVADHAELEDKLRGFEAGIDEYLAGMPGWHRGSDSVDSSLPERRRKTSGPEALTFCGLKTRKPRRADSLSMALRVMARW